MLQGKESPGTLLSSSEFRYRKANSKDSKPELNFSPTFAGDFISRLRAVQSPSRVQARPVLTGAVLERVVKASQKKPKK